MFPTGSLLKATAGFTKFILFEPRPQWIWQKKIYQSSKQLPTSFLTKFIHEHEPCSRFIPHAIIFGKTKITYCAALQWLHIGKTKNYFQRLPGNQPRGKAAASL